MAETHVDPKTPAAVRAVGVVRRVRAAWRELAPEQRLSALAALFLLGTMFTPWYSATHAVVAKGQARSASEGHIAISVFSFVEAAVLLVALAVLWLLFARGERRAFHLPGGDGVVITAAGVWACILIFWRFFDKPDLGAQVTVGLKWGIFVALAAAVSLVVSGNNVRAAHRPEPELVPREPERPFGEPVEVRIPEERPHLEETRVLSDRAPQTPAARGGGPLALSREAAAQDTAEFRAVPPTAPDEAQKPRRDPAASPEEDDVGPADQPPQTKT
jgi:hypothetical protein